MPYLAGSGYRTGRVRSISQNQVFNKSIMAKENPMRHLLNPLDFSVRRAVHPKADGVGDPTPDGRTVQAHQNALHRRTKHQ